jgi:hypothetical protein
VAIVVDGCRNRRELDETCWMEYAQVLVYEKVVQRFQLRFLYFFPVVIKRDTDSKTPCQPYRW